MHILVLSALCDYAGVPPVAVSQRVGRVWQSSAALCLGAAGSLPGIAAVDAGLLTHRTPGKDFFVCWLCNTHTQAKHNVNLYIILELQLGNPVKLCPPTCLFHAWLCLHLRRLRLMPRVCFSK